MKPSLTVITNIQVHKCYPLYYKLTVNNHAKPTKVARAHPARPILIRAIRQLWRTTITLCMLSCSTEAFAQTTIAVARNTAEVSLAADSRGLDIKTGTPLAVCKIRQVGEFWVAVAGHSNTQVGFAGIRIAGIDIWTALDEAVKTKGSQYDKVEAFVRIFRVSLGRLMYEVRLHNEARYREIPPLISSVIFASVDKGVPVFFIRDFLKAGPIDPKDNPLFKMTDPVRIGGEELTGPLQSTQIQVTCRGACKDCGTCPAGGFIANVIKTGIDLKPADLTHFIVAYSALVLPTVVGPPIEVLRINKNGRANWVQHETCKDAAEKPKPLPKKRARRR